MYILKKQTWFGTIFLLGIFILISELPSLSLAQRSSPGDSPTPHPKKEQYRDAMEEYFVQLGEINLNPKSYPTYNDYYQDLITHIEEIIHNIENLELLEVLFYKCNNQKWRSVDDPYALCAEVILRRLKKIGTEESVKLLVKLFADETIGYDGGYATSICNSLVWNGDIAVKYLLKVKNTRKRSAQKVIEIIKKGRRSCI
jgi:hypothetical protein